MEILSYGDTVFKVGGLESPCSMSSTDKVTRIINMGGLTKGKIVWKKKKVVVFVVVLVRRNKKDGPGIRDRPYVSFAMTASMYHTHNGADDEPLSHQDHHYSNSYWVVVIRLFSSFPFLLHFFFSRFLGGSLYNMTGNKLTLWADGLCLCLNNKKKKKPLDAK